jgi:hypothetical protein
MQIHDEKFRASAFIVRLLFKKQAEKDARGVFFGETSIFETRVFLKWRKLSNDRNS